MKNTLDFIVIGAQKAGTTSLFEYLRRHPEIYLPLGKEAAYFSHDAEVSLAWEQYLSRHFSMADPNCKWGTVSPSYMVGGVYDATSRHSEARGYSERTVPLRISRRLPAVRLVALLRDPIERARSHHKMMVMNGRERRSFDDAIRELLQPHALKKSRAWPDETTGYVTWGEYGRILTGYCEVFPREQMLVAFTDELEHTPEQFLLRVHAFLGVRSDVIPDNLGVRYREGGSTRRFPGLNPDESVRSIARNPLTRRLWHSLPRGARYAISRGYADLAYRMDLWNRHSQEKLDEPSAATVARLREHFASDADRISALLGASVPWHQMPQLDERE